MELVIRGLVCAKHLNSTWHVGNTRWHLQLCCYYYYNCWCYLRFHGAKDTCLVAKKAPKGTILLLTGNILPVL